MSTRMRADQLDSGTGANQVVKLDGSSRLPAVDGSQLTGVGGGGLFSESTNGNILGGTNAGVNLVAGSPAVGGADNFIGGKNSGTSLTTGDYNIIVGNNSGTSLNTDYNTLVLGYNSWNNNSSGYDNIIVGNNIDIAPAATWGRESIIVGNNVGAGTHGGLLSCVLVGNNIASEPAGVGNLLFSVIIGDDAAQHLESDNSSVIIGRNAGQSASTTYRGVFSSNVLIGSGAGEDQYTTSHNVAIGKDAMKGWGGSSTIGDRNVGVGTGTVKDLESGSGNAALGYEALNDVDTGSENVGIGYWAGETITSGSNNICIGTRSGPNFGDPGQTADNILYVDVTRRSDPLLGGNFGSPRRIDINGNLEVTGNVLSHIDINAQTGTTYTLVLSDDGILVTMNNASANTLRVPTDTDVAFPNGTQILVEQEGAGTTTIESAGIGSPAGGSPPGVAIHSAGGLRDLASQYSAVTLIKKSANTWLLAGDLA